MYIAKTKALISFAVIAKLICVFVFAYAKSRFSRRGSYHKLYSLSHYLMPYRLSMLSEGKD